MAQALAMTFESVPATSPFQASFIKAEPQDPLYPAFTSEYDDVDLDAALFDAGMDWDGTGLETCFFDDQFPTDGTVPSLSDLSSDDLGLAGSASCSSLDSNYSSGANDAGEVPTLRKVPTAQRSSRRGPPAAPSAAAVPTAAAPARSIPSVAPPRLWCPPSELPPLTMTREERVQRYREKRKRRTFEKTIRYEARRAYAEVRPRIKGRFATKDEAAAMKAARLAGVPYEC